MTQDPLTLYKLIILYMLNRVDFPLTRNQIGDCFLDRGYTNNYLSVQQSIGELMEADMVTAKKVRNRTQLKITKEGEQALAFFQSKIHDDIRSDIDRYLKENKFKLKSEMAVFSDYYKTLNGDYEAILSVKEKNANIIELKLSIPTEKIASDICENWTKKHEEVYEFITKELF